MKRYIGIISYDKRELPIRNIFANILQKKLYEDSVFPDVEISPIEIGPDDTFDFIWKQVVENFARHYFIPDKKSSQEEYKKNLNILYSYKKAVDLRKDELLKAYPQMEKDVPDRQTWSFVVRRNIDYLANKSAQEQAKKAFSKWIKFQ